MSAAAENIIEPGSKEWHEERRKGIGASDASAVCGLSRWTTAYDLYMEKTGQMEPAEENEYMHRGKVLEEPLARVYMLREGLDSLGPERHCRHAEIEWMTATPDREIDSSTDLEVKTATAWNSDEWGPEGTQEIPDEYFIQCQHSLAVTGKECMELIVCLADDKVFSTLVQALDSQHMNVDAVAALMDNNLDIRIYPIERDEGTIASIISAEEDFWEEHIVKGVPPVNYDTVRPDKSKQRTATPEEAEMVATYHELWMEEKKAAAQLDELQAKIKNAIGEDYGLDCGDLGNITWGKNKDSEFEKVDLDVILDELSKRGVDEDLIADARKKGTQKVIKEGSRVFRVPTSRWKKDLGI